MSARAKRSQLHTDIASLNQFLDQYDQLKFEHNGLPEGFNNVKPVINIFLPLKNSFLEKVE